MPILVLLLILQPINKHSVSMTKVLLKMDWSTFFTWKELWAWSEVWALFIPLTILIIKRNNKERELKPVVYYVIIALLLNFIADFMWRFHSVRRLDIKWMWNNSSVYHVHSIARLLLFCWFFNRLKEPFLVKIKKYIPHIYLLFVIITFTIIKPISSFIFDYSSELHAAEAAILLIYCLQHYVYLAQAEQISLSRNRSVSWIVAGLTIYFGINFFIFLFYSALIDISTKFSKDIWNVHNASYVLFCCFIAKGLYESDKS